MIKSSEALPPIMEICIEKKYVLESNISQKVKDSLVKTVCTILFISCMDEE